MRKTIILFLAVTAGLIACDSPTETESNTEWTRVKGLNLPLNLSLRADVLDSISFHLDESPYRPSDPYWLQVSASLEGNELRIDVKNYVLKPNGGWGILSRARWWQALPFGPGTKGVYEVSIHLGKQSDQYHLVVEEGSCWLSGVDGQFSGIERGPVTRDPGS